LEQRDLLKDKIEKLAKVLAAVLGKFLDIKDESQMIAGIESTNIELIENANIDYVKMIPMGLGDLREYVLSHQMNDDHLEMLSKYSFQLGKLNTNNQNQLKDYNLLARNLLLIASEISQTTSFSRIALENQVNKAANLNNGTDK